MKKTSQSLITAALFAAAVSTGTAFTPQLASAENDITTVPQTSYGPPVCLVTEPETTEMLIPEGTVPIISEDTTTTATDPEILRPQGEVAVFTTTEEDVVQLVGEPVMYEEPGDFNLDGSIDARDLTMLKQYLLHQLDGVGFSYDISDLNHDGALNKKDVKALIRMLTGKPEEEDTPEETTTAVTRNTETFTLPTETTTDVTRDTYVVLYGPPAAWD